MMQLSEHLQSFLDKLSQMDREAMMWLVIGFTGQILFFMRFFIQWIASEKKKQSIIPTAFWYFSISGGSVLLAYAIWKQDPVFILGQSLGVVIYLRNLYFIHGKPKTSGE